MDTITKKVKFVTYRYSHHSSHSGYDRLASYGQNEVIRAQPFSRKLIRNKIIWRIANGVISYDRESLATELKTGWQMLRERGYIYHILYGENTYHYLGMLNNVGRNRLVATYHLVPAVFRDSVRIDWHIRQLSAVVCVGRSQLDFFANIVGEDKVFFVPHGIDTEYFCPPQSTQQRNPNLCIMVGNYLRDFATFRGVVELVAYRRPETQFVAVIAEKNFKHLGCHPNLTLRTGISETELLQLYQSAAVMVMPLWDATANNGILEGLACGVPVVVTDVGSIGDYVDAQCGILTPPHDSRAMAESVLKLLADPGQRQEMSEQARTQALQFAWPKVAQQMHSVYQAIA